MPENNKEKKKDSESDDSSDRVVSIQSNLHLLSQIPLQDVRNFCFIAHVDHGKSSLASRLLEYTGNLGEESQQQSTINSSGSEANPATSCKEQFELLDTLSVEQERGITVKASAATMLYRHDSAVGPHGVLLLNMVDTPGHVDFGNEVMRSLFFVQGCILLLDAQQGIQAQTLRVHDMAREIFQRQLHRPSAGNTESDDDDLPILVALTKIDMENARPEQVALSAAEWLQINDPDESILYTSARNRIGIEDILNAVATRIPPPSPTLENSDIMQAQVVDSWFNPKTGVNCLVQVLAGQLQEGDKVSFTIANEGNSGEKSKNTSVFSVQEIGLLLPKSLRTKQLGRGQMGYVRFGGVKDPRQAQPGTLLTDASATSDLILTPPLPPSLHPKDQTSVLYASVHPVEEDGLDDLWSAVEKLALNDSGLDVAKNVDSTSAEPSNKKKKSKGKQMQGENDDGPVLGPGLRVGFQGLLHVEVFRQRLMDEFGLDAMVTPPKVPYTITYLPDKHQKGNSNDEQRTEVIQDLSQWPPWGARCIIQEPMVQIRVLAPAIFAGPVMELIQRKRGSDMESRPMDGDGGSGDDSVWIFTARMPWGEVVTDMHDLLKNMTAGQGSLDTQECDPPFQEANFLQKVEILLNQQVVEPLAFICHRDDASAQGRLVCQKLQNVLPRRQFVTIIQARAGGKVVASERIRAYRKDVLVKSGKTVGGGDVTRKKKLLEKQKRGKRKQQESGRVTLSQAAFNSVISRTS